MIERLRSRFDVSEYGQVDYPPAHYPMFALRSRNWREALPVVLVSGGVHGALLFADKHAGNYAGRCNL